MDHWQPIDDDVAYPSVSQPRWRRSVLRNDRASGRGRVVSADTGLPAGDEEKSSAPVDLIVVATVGGGRNEVDEEEPKAVWDDKGGPQVDYDETRSFH